MCGKSEKNTARVRKSGNWWLHLNDNLIKFKIKIAKKKIKSRGKFEENERDQINYKIKFCSITFMKQMNYGYCDLMRKKNRFLMIVQEEENI